MISKTLDSNFYSNLICIHQQLEYLASIFEHINFDTSILSINYNYKMVSYLAFFFNFIR